MTRPLLRFDPATGSEKPYPSESEQYREYHGNTAWLYNPYTGKLRDARDIGSDTFGHLIAPEGKNPLPEPEYDPKDFRIDTYIPSGTGSGWVSRPAYAVRITHLKSGLTASCETERGQHANKAKAFEQLLSMLKADELKCTGKPGSDY